MHLCLGKFPHWHLQHNHPQGSSATRTASRAKCARHLPPKVVRTPARWRFLSSRTKELATWEQLCMWPNMHVRLWKANAVCTRFCLMLACSGEAACPREWSCAAGARQGGGWLGRSIWRDGKAVCEKVACLVRWLTAFLVRLRCVNSCVLLPNNSCSKAFKILAKFLAAPKL